MSGLVLRLSPELFAGHPGGAESLRAAAGGDATKAFAAHSQHARRWADEHVIGAEGFHTLPMS